MDEDEAMHEPYPHEEHFDEENYDNQGQRRQHGLRNVIDRREHVVARAAAMRDYIMVQMLMWHNIML